VKKQSAFLIGVLLLIVACPAFSKDHSTEYVVGVFSATGQLSDGSYAFCSGHGCAGFNAAHNIHYVRTAEGMYAIEAPVSLGGTFALAMLAGAAAPTVHKEWFMDQLHEGDKILFASRCNKHNDCVFYLPNPDHDGKEYTTAGYYRADVAKTNTQNLCGKGKLSAAVEAQVCSAQPASKPVTQ
jgi:hypothetical protein